MKRRWLLLVPLVALAVTPPTRMQGADPPARDLTDLFEPGYILQDRNGDGVIDFLNFRLVTDAEPSAEAVAAATDVAARFAHETMAMNLPVAGAADAPAVVVGVAAGLKPGATGPETVGTFRSASTRPGSVAPTFRSATTTSPRSATGSIAVTDKGIIVSGADVEGLLAAARAFARLPYVLDAKSATLDRIAQDVGSFLEGRGLKADSVTVPEILVAGRDGAVDRVVVSVPVPTVTARDTARRHFEALGRDRPDPKRALSYAGVSTVSVRLSTPALPANAFVTVDVPAQLPPADDGPLPRRAASNKDNLDLSSLYSNDGFFGDSDNNLIPDRTEALLVPHGAGTARTIDLGARLALESAGVALPIARPASLTTRPESDPTLVLIGDTHPLVDRLIEQGKLARRPLAPGEGLIQVVRKAFGEKSAVVVTGGDRAGVARALEQVAERFPHVWARGKDRTTIDDVEEDVRRFVAGRSPAGQAASAVYKLGRLAASLKGRDLAYARVRVLVEKAADGLADFMRREAATLFKADRFDLRMETLDVQRASPLVDEDVEIPSEVDEFWTTFRARVLPAVRRNKPVAVEVRLSEPPAVRARIAANARTELLRAGAAESGTSVRVLSAYKQGFFWLDEVIKPELAEKPVQRITIRFAELGPPTEWTQQGMFAPTRWLLEIYPIDEVLARDLKIDLSRIIFEKRPVGSPTYEVIASDAGGVELLRRTFEPKLVVRPFFDQFPDYEKVRVTTGWISASVNGRSVADERIVTDPERFWSHFQRRTLPALYRHVMAVSKGKPRPEDAPFFGELRVELTLSEPDYRLGIDEEQIAPLEAIHEEIYFNTLHFFDVLGRYARGPALTYPGRVIPVVRPKQDGRAGRARITATGFSLNRPAVVVEYQPRGELAAELRLDVPKVAVDRPSAMAARVRAGSNGLTSLDVRVKVDTRADERDALVARASEDRVDRTIMSAAQVDAMVAILRRLREAGLYRDELAYHDLGELRIAAAWTHDPDATAEFVATLPPNGTPPPFPDISGLGTPVPNPLVQWDTPIPPPEAYQILAKMSTFAEATVYNVGQSYLGKDVWAMDLMPPIAASHWSQAKATTFKPTIVYSARQHANEVSSTSHVLKLAELLLTDPAFKAKLRKVNVVIHPITNPDGAQLAYDLYKITPRHMLHAGYLGPLGVDVTSAQWDADPIYPESAIRPKIWRTWLPDIFLNPHGYPSHEWVQPFSEYAAWVRTRAVETRDYWSMRGWWMPGFGYLDDPRYPRHKEEQFKIRSLITSAIGSVPEVRALNERAYERYRRYTVTFDQKNFKLDFSDGVLMYTSIKGSRASPTADDFMSRQPNVTIWMGSTEAPDETASGDWLRLVATAGLTWDKAVLDYLVQGDHQIERKQDLFYGGVSLSLSRPRPPKKKTEKETTQ